MVPVMSMCVSSYPLHGDVMLNCLICRSIWNPEQLQRQCCFPRNSCWREQGHVRHWVFNWELLPQLEKRVQNGPCYGRFLRSKWQESSGKSQSGTFIEWSVWIHASHPFIKEFAKKWAEENDKIFSGTAETTKFSEFDRRWLWSTYGKVSDPEQGAILDTVWDKYFDTRWW